MPIHTHILSPSQYGLWNIWSSVRTFFEQLVDMGQKSVIQKKFHSDQNFSDVLVSTISLLFLGSTLTFLTLLIVSLFVDSLFGIQMGYYLLIPLFALGTEIFIINTVLLRHENKPLQFCIFQLGYAFGVAFLGIGFVLLFENSWIGLLIGAGATLIILSALCLWQFYKKYNISFVIDKRQMLGLFLVGWPMIFYGINTMVISMSDRLILSEIMGAAIVGIYSANYKIGMSIQIVMYAVINTVVPWQYKQLKSLSETSKMNLAIFSTVYKLATILLAIIIVIMAPMLVELLFSSEYQGMNDVIFWTVLAGLAQAWYSIYFHILVFYEKTKTFFIVSCVASTLNIALTIFLTLLLGAVGAAMATCIAYTTILIALWYTSNQLINLPWKQATKKIIRYTLGYR